MDEDSSPRGLPDPAQVPPSGRAGLTPSSADAALPAPGLVGVLLSAGRYRLTPLKGKTLAMLYRAVVPGTKEPVRFSSPWRTITLDRVEDVSADVELAGGNRFVLTGAADQTTGPDVKSPSLRR